MTATERKQYFLVYINDDDENNTIETRTEVIKLTSIQSLVRGRKQGVNNHAEGNGLLVHLVLRGKMDALFS